MPSFFYSRGDHMSSLEWTLNNNGNSVHISDLCETSMIYYLPYESRPIFRKFPSDTDLIDKKAFIQSNLGDIDKRRINIYVVYTHTANNIDAEIDDLETKLNIYLRKIYSGIKINLYTDASSILNPTNDPNLDRVSLPSSGTSNILDDAINNHTYVLALSNTLNLSSTYAGYYSDDHKLIMVKQDFGDPFQEIIAHEVIHLLNLGHVEDIMESPNNELEELNLMNSEFSYGYIGMSHKQVIAMNDISGNGTQVFSAIELRNDFPLPQTEIQSSEIVSDGQEMDVPSYLISECSNSQDSANGRLGSRDPTINKKLLDDLVTFSKILTSFKPKKGNPIRDQIVRRNKEAYLQQYAMLGEEYLEMSPEEFSNKKADSFVKNLNHKMYGIVLRHYTDFQNIDRLKLEYLLRSINNIEPSLKLYFDGFRN